jgi:hypothetical protein
VDEGRIKTDVEKVLHSGGPILALVDTQSDDLAAFARVLTDGVYKAMIFDVIVKITWRNTGLGGLLMETVMNDPAIVDIKHREMYCLEEMVPFYEKWDLTAALTGLILCGSPLAREPMTNETRRALSPTPGRRSISAPTCV